MDRNGNRNGINGYDPYTYQPMMRAFYMGGRFPQEITRAQEENPAAAQHIGAVFQFSRWLQDEMPDAYAHTKSRHPELLDPLAVVDSGGLAVSSPASSTGNSLAGMGEVIYDLNGQPYNTEDSGSGDLSQTMTQWGKSITDLAKSYLVYDTQRKLLDVNIARAEKGLPPLDAAAYGMGVNVGLTPDMQKILIFGGVALLLVMAMRGRA